MKTITEVRNYFWSTYTQFADLKRSKKRQNDYPADVRMTFIDMVDSLQKDGTISEKLARRVTL